MHKVPLLHSSALCALWKMATMCAVSLHCLVGNFYALHLLLWPAAH